MSDCPPLVSAAPVGGYVVEVRFADGVSRRVDMEPFLRANAGHEAIAPYLDPERFAEVQVAGGDLAWGEDWDILFDARAVRAGAIGGEPVGAGER